MNNPPTHTCGWTVNPEDKYCRGCGDRIFKVSRDYAEIKAEMDQLRITASDKPNPGLVSLAMTMFNVLAWAAGEANTRPADLLSEIEKVIERIPGWGFPKPPPER
jgi:hypothetical protein